MSSIADFKNVLCYIESLHYSTSKCNIQWQNVFYSIEKVPSNVKSENVLSRTKNMLISIKIVLLSSENVFPNAKTCYPK